MIEDNLKLVHYVLHKLNIKQDYEDYFQIGCIGLIKAERAYKEEKGKFSSFAVNCIRNEINMTFRKKRVNTISLDEIVNDERNTKLEDMLSNTETDMLVSVDVKEAVDRALKRTPTKKKAICIQYIREFGESNVSDLGKQHGISKTLAHRTIAEFKEVLKEELKNLGYCIYNEGQE